MIVLAVGCHPDDLEISCGGTLRKYVEQGADVYMCHVANGCHGHVVIEPEELRRIRTLEAERAGAIIGAKEVFNLDVNDMEVNCHDLAVMDAMADIVRKVRPDVIIAHNKEDYMLDHEQASIIATNGAFCAGLNHRPRQFEAVSSFAPVFYMDTANGVNFEPTHYVDITGQMDVKLQAMECHESQVKWLREHDNIDILEKIRVHAQFRGFQCGVNYAEGFRPYNVSCRVPVGNLLPY